MTTNNRSLDPLMALLGQAERERDAALADLQRAGDLQRSAEMQLEQLRQYRTEYEGRFREQFKTPQGIAALQGYQVFSDRLSQAIEQQSRAVTHAEARAEQMRLLVIEQEMRVASVRKLLERRLNEMKLGAERREQRQTDEFASRAAWSRLARPSGFMPAL